MNDRHDNLDSDPVADGRSATGDASTNAADEACAARPEAVVERLIELAVYAPVGVAVTLRDELPKHIKQGRQAVENRVQLARFIGQLAVQTGQRELQKRIDQQRAAREAVEAEHDATIDGSTIDGSTIAGSTITSVTSDRTDTASAIVSGRSGDAPAAEPEGDLAGAGVGTSSAAPAAPADAPSAAELPISDYESLPAINVVDRLRSMSADEIELVRRFEVANRSRRTILAKIDQLQDRQADGEH